MTVVILLLWGISLLLAHYHGFCTGRLSVFKEWEGLVRDPPLTQKEE